MADEDRSAWERAGTFEVAPGVHRIPLPLPGDGLRAVNVYAIETGEDVVLVDAGWSRPAARDALADGLGAIGRDLPMVSGVLATHVHRDHYGQGTWLQQHHGSHLALGAGERPSLERVFDPATPDEPAIVARLRGLGAPDLADAVAAAAGEMLEVADYRRAWSLPDQWLAHEQAVEVGDRTLRVLATPGHTQGHVVFVDEEAGLLLAGDHVLPHITPSIGFEPVHVDSALGDYLASLALVRGLPDLRLLPAHGPVRPTFHDRVDELLVHHDERLRRTLAAVAAGRRTAAEVARGLPWTRRERAFDDLDPFNQALAVNETAAHLEVLAERGAVEVAIVEVADHDVRSYA